MKRKKELDQNAEPSQPVTAADGKTVKKKKKKSNTSTIILVIVFIIGLSLLLYPSLSNYWNSFHATASSQIITKHWQT